MTRKISQILQGLALAAGLFTAACSGATSVSPTAPGATGPTSGAATGAVITGRVTGMSGASSSLVTAPISLRSASTDANAIVVTVLGTNLSTIVGAAGDFTLSGVPSGSVQLQFTGRGTSATVTISGVQVTDRIDIAVALTGSVAKVESDNRRREDNNGVEVNGRVTAIGASTLQVGTTLVSVSTTTIIRHGSTLLSLTAIAVGDHVEVKGTKTAAGVTATEIKVESQSDDDDAPASGGTTGSNGAKPNTESDESGKGGTNGGSSSSGKDGEDDDADEKASKDAKSDDLKGAVTSLGTSACPRTSFVIKGVTVTTSAATKFDGIACDAIKVGTSLEVTGTRSGSALTATKVERD